LARLSSAGAANHARCEPDQYNAGIFCPALGLESYDGAFDAVAREPALAGFALFFLAVILYPLPGHFLEQQHRRDVVANRRCAVALVGRSSGLETVIVDWVSVAWTGAHAGSREP
jgi:hypothetical protein